MWNNVKFGMLTAAWHFSLFEIVFPSHQISFLLSSLLVQMTYKIKNFRILHNIRACNLSKEKNQNAEIFFISPSNESYECSCFIVYPIYLRGVRNKNSLKMPIKLNHGMGFFLLFKFLNENKKKYILIQRKSCICHIQTSD